MLASACAFANPGHAKDTSFNLIQRGRYLATAGDCVACHTSEKGKPFAGGRAIETPFGIIYSPNITPDRETGIGAWSDDDFYRALHSGVGPDDTRLYPAFPYPYFTKMSRDDVAAVRAFLNTLEPVKSERPASQLTWPLGYRFLMRGWNWMFFDEGAFRPDPAQSAEWNRGAYLVRGPGHCGGCHTPKNFAGGDKKSQRLEGGQIQNWFAPQLANNHRFGTGSWSVEEIVEYLKTGRNSRSGATGLMAEVVTDSTSKLEPKDLRAIAVYLKSKAPSSAVWVGRPDETSMETGRAIFNASCAACHKQDGSGVPRMFPPLAHNANAQSTDATTVVRVILQGAQTVSTDERPTPATMPAFDWKLSNAEVAAVATYVRNSWGNAAPTVSVDQVKTLRETLRPKTK